MKKIIEILKGAAAVMALCALFVTSCQKLSDSQDVLDVSVKTPSVTSGKGQMFVNVKCNSAWTLSLTDAENGSDIDWASLNITSGNGNMNNVVLSYQGNDSQQSRMLNIILDNGNQWVSCTVTQTGYGQQPDPLPVPDVDLTKVDWLELPAMDDPELGYYSHSFEMDGKTYRNYSFGWSQKNLVSHWVAYPLCRMYSTKNVNRKDEWAYDPLLGSNSSAPFSYYGRSTPTDINNDPYARGHQLPSADRLCCREANRQTFYGTNMTPQLFDHNGGIWEKLESKVRAIAERSDTTYVVTGCIVEGEKIVYDSDGKKMAVPIAYFKALLRFSKSSTIGQWNAAAFYLEHRAYSEGIGKQHSMSIDELEDITGIDFFVNLPARIGEEQAAKLEAADPADSAVWW